LAEPLIKEQQLSVCRGPGGLLSVPAASKSSDASDLVKVQSCDNMQRPGHYEDNYQGALQISCSCAEQLREDSERPTSSGAGLAMTVQISHTIFRLIVCEDETPAILSQSKCPSCSEKCANYSEVSTN